MNNTPAPEYRPDIDGLRAIAVLAVVAFHAFPHRLSGGFIGVDVFFVISGFLISQNILRELRAGRFTLGSFWGRRIRRIFPALTVVLITTVFLGWHVLLAEEFAAFGKYVAAGAGFSSNFFLWADSGYFDATAHQKPLLHLWSLGIEEQFYIAWPLLLWLGWRARMRPAVVMLVVVFASFLWSLTLLEDAAVEGFYSPLARVWELAIGGVLAVGVAQTPLGASRSRLADVASALGLVLIAVGAWRLESTAPYPGWAALVPTLGAALVIVAGADGWVNRHLLSRRALVAIGLISFPLYLWHWPLLSFLHIVSSGTASGAHRALVVVISLVLSWLTYRLVERPIRTGAVRLSTSLALSAVLAVVGTAGYVTYKSDGFPERLQAFEDQVRAIRTVVENTEECKAALPIKGLRYCQLANPAAPPTVVLFGDSHANRLFVPFSTRYASQGDNLLQIGGAGCLPFWGIETGRAGEPYGCDVVMPPQLDYIVSSPTISTVVLLHRGPVHIEGHDLFSPGDRLIRRATGATGESRVELYRAGLTEVLTRFRAAGKRVVVLLDAPEFSYDPTSCMDLVRPYGSPFVRRPDCRIPRADVRERNRQYEDITRDVSAAIGGLQVVDLKGPLCDSDYCHGIREGRLLYRDADHLNVFGAEYVVGRLWPFAVQ